AHSQRAAELLRRSHGLLGGLPVDVKNPGEGEDKLGALIQGHVSVSRWAHLKRRLMFEARGAGRCSRDCAAVDIQIIGRKAHPPTSLNGWVGCQNEPVCESSCLPDNLGFPRMQAVSVCQR